MEQQKIKNSGNNFGQQEKSKGITIPVVLQSYTD